MEVCGVFIQNISGADQNMMERGRDLWCYFRLDSAIVSLCCVSFIV